MPFIALIPVINSGKLDVQLYQYRFQLCVCVRLCAYERWEATHALLQLFHRSIGSSPSITSHNDFDPPISKVSNTGEVSRGLNVD